MLILNNVDTTLNWSVTCQFYIHYFLFTIIICYRPTYYLLTGNLVTVEHDVMSQKVIMGFMYGLIIVCKQFCRDICLNQN